VTTVANLTVSSPAQLAAIIPVIHEAAPAGNAFILTLNDQSDIIGTLRYKMPDPPDPAIIIGLSRRALIQLQHPPFDAAAVAVVAAFGPAHVADPMVDALDIMLGAADITLMDAIRVRDGRCWSYTDGDPDGEVVDPLDDAVIEMVTVIGQQEGTGTGG
jgi:Domain of unknown function (DUF4192)